MDGFRAHFLRWWPYIAILLIVLTLFYKTVISGNIPFPGDLVLSEYAPWRHAAYFGYAPGAIPSKAQYFDVARELYPWKTLVVDQLKKFQMPLWNPYNFSGGPLLANYQSQVFYPPGILYLILPQPVAWTILVILQPLLGSIFLYLFAAEIGFSAGAALIAALLFNFSSFANVWMEFNTVWHTILWLPLLLYLFEKSLKEKHITLTRKICYIAALFSSITGGHPQDFIYTFLFLLTYETVRLWTTASLTSKEKQSLVLHTSVITVIPLFLAGPQLLPTIELFRYSSRVPHDVGFITTTMLVQWWQLVMVFVQDFFGNPATHSFYLSDTYVNKALSTGVAGFMLVVFGLFQKKRPWHFKFFLGSACLILTLTTNTPVSQLFYRFPIPVLSTGSPTRILFLLAFSLSILAGYGFDYVRSILYLKKIITPLAVCTALIASLWIITFLHPMIGTAVMNVTTSRRSLIVATALLIAFIAITLLSRINRKSYYFLILIITAELFYSFTKFNPFVPKSFLYPPHEVLTFLQTHAGINRFWGYGTTRMESNLNLQYKLYSTDGTDPLNLAWYNKFIQSSANGKLPQTFTRVTRSDVALTPGYGESDLPGNYQRLRIMNLLGVKYVLDRFDNPKNNTTFSADQFKAVYSSSDGYTIYENIRSIPRAFLADTVEYYATDAEFEHIFFDPSFDPGKTILIPASLSVPTLEAATQKEAVIESYSPNSLRIHTNSDKRQMLFLSDTWAPGWQAKIDNKSTPIYLADYAFRAIVVPEGSHIVQYDYQPESFTTGAVISAFGFLLLFTDFVFIPILKKRQKTQRD